MKEEQPHHHTSNYDRFMSGEYCNSLNQEVLEMISNTIEYYTRLQRIKAANTCNNDVLDYEIRAIELKLRSFGVDFNELKLV